jgi:hypothetical protein
VAGAKLALVPPLRRHQLAPRREFMPRTSLKNCPQVVHQLENPRMDGSRSTCSSQEIQDPELDFLRYLVDDQAAVEAERGQGPGTTDKTD